MKKHIRLALPLIGVVMLAACGPDAEELFARAQKSFAAQDYVSARLDLSSALREQPGNVRMLTMLAQAHLRLGDADGAGAALARLVGVGGRGPEITEMQAEVLLLQERHDEALAQLGDLGTPAAWRIRALAHQAKGDAASALAAFQSGMAAGADARLAADYARYLLLSRQPEKALPILAEMRRTAATSFETMVLEGDVAAALGKVDEAIAAYRKVIGRFPGRIEPMIALANQLDIKGDLEGALAALEQAESASPGDRRLVSLKVQLYSVKGDWEKVRSTLQSQEGELDPNSAEGLSYAEAQLRLGHPEQARTLFSRAVLMAPQNRYARMMLGEALFASNDARGAYEALKPLADSPLAQQQELDAAARAARAAGDPDAPALEQRLKSSEFKAALALVQNGQRALVRQDWNAAIDAYSRMLASGPDADVLQRLAFACSKAGRHDEAIAHADAARALAPQNPDAVHMAGLARLNAGRDLGQAIALLRAAAGANPGNETYKADLERAEAAAS